MTLTRGFPMMITPAADEVPVPMLSSRASTVVSGAASGTVRVLLRFEGAVALIAAVVLYGREGFSWPLFAVLLLAPDLTMLAYLAGPRFGAAVYNAVHTYVPALTLALIGFLAAIPLASACGLIWIAHIGMDRTLGYGLKYSTAFADTHLGNLRRR
jgi:Domain of unknown function (DUF4260)